MKDIMFRELPDNFSRLIIPFYMNDKNGKCSQALFLSEDWTRLRRSSVYLTGYMNEIFGGGAGDICGFFMLNDKAWDKAGLPSKGQVVHIVSEIRDGVKEDFTFSLECVWAAYFATGIGFLFLDIGHKEDEGVKEITDKCFALINCFIKRTSRYSGKNVVRFQYFQGENVFEFQLADAIKNILDIPGHKDIIKLFPTNMRSKISAYHRLYCEKVSEEDIKYAGYLSKGMHSEAVIQETNDMFETEFEYRSGNNMRWSITSVSVVAITEKIDGREDFITRKHLEHIEKDYFLIYLFGLHEREILLWYNYQVVSNWNAGGKLIKYRDELIRFNMWFSYNTVSCEMAYQNFYECLYKVLKLENLERDVQEVVAKVSEYESGIKDDRMNIFLSIITIVTTVSLCGELTDFIKLIINNESSRIAEIIGMMAAGVTILIAVIAIIVNEKGRRRKQNKWLRRKE